MLSSIVNSNIIYNGCLFVSCAVVVYSCYGTYKTAYDYALVSLSIDKYISANVY